MACTHGFQGEGNHPPKSQENRDGCNTGPIRVGGMARSLVWSSEHVGRILLRGAGEEELAPLHWVRHLNPGEHPASVARFLVWVLGKDRSRSAAPAFCSPPSSTPQSPSPWCLPSHGCLVFVGPPLPSAPPVAPPLRVVPGSWQVCYPLGSPHSQVLLLLAGAAAPRGPGCLLLASVLGPASLESILCFLGPSRPVLQALNGSFLSASACPRLISRVAPLP